MTDASTHEQEVTHLRETEITLRQILDNTTTVRVFAKDLSGRYLFVNRAFEQHAGRPAGEIVGLTPGDIAPPDVATGVRANDRRVIETGIPLEIEETNVIRGERRTLLANKFPLLGADGKPYAVCGISIDITERKRTEEALRRAALAVSTAAGPQVFETLVRQLTEILGASAAMITVFFDARRTHMRSLAACVDGRLLGNFEYEVAGSPCAGVIGQEFRYAREGVHPEFAPGTLFSEQRFDSYAAYSLSATSGEQLGLIVVMDRRPLADRSLTEAMLKIFAVRVSAELERTRTEEALRVSEASYRAIFEASEDAIFVHDWDTGAILDVSPKAAEIYGHSREALRSLRVGDVSADVPPYTEDDAMRQIQRAKVHGGPLRFDWLARHADGHLMWNEVTLKRAAIAGEPRILAFVRDVTEHRRAEEALRASEEQYRAVFNASADGLTLRDADFRVVDVNPALLAMTGLTREEAVGSTRLLFTPPEDQAATLELFRRELGGEASQFETEAVRKDGTRFAAEVRGVPLQYRGQPHVFVIARDITERKRAEEEVRASEEQYRAIFNASADALVLWNSALKRVDVNPAYERLYGVTREEVLGTGHADDLPADYVALRRNVISRTLAGEACQLEVDAVRKTGERLQIEVRTIPVRHRGEPHALAIVRDVTERKRAEEALRTSEEQYRTIFNASVDGLLLWDSDHRIVDVNQAFLSMHGFGRDELLGRIDPFFIPPDLQPGCATLLPEILGGAPCHIEARTRRKDGTELDVEIHGVPMQYRGRPHALVILRDITESKRAEKQLRDSEERYRLLFETESDAILLVDVATLRLVDANPAAEGLWGYGRAELLALTVADLSAEPEESRTSIQSRTGRVHVPLRMHRKKDGTVFPVEITANRLMLDGRLTVVAAVRDITERRRAEEALKANEEQYRAMFNASADALVLRDADFRIVDVNATYEKMSGYRREEVIGVDRLLANPPEYGSLIRDLHRRALAGEPVLIETQLIRRDGLCQEVELRGVPLQHRSRPHVLWLGRDITARKQGETERRELEAQLRQTQKMEAIGQLAGGIAHDFNNILTSVMGNLTLAADRAPAREDARLAAYIDRALGSAERARDLVQQLLTFSRGRRGDPRPVMLAPLLRDALKLARSTLPSSIDLASSIARALPQVMLDPVHVDQVLLNLCINARDAMDGRGAVRVVLRSGELQGQVCASCRSRVSGLFVELAVADDGPGIPPEVLDRVFEPFFTTKEVGKGSGMGLATVHGIVHEHGGHVLVETAPGLGCTFRVLLPALQAVDEDPGTMPPVGRGARGALTGRVLVVDDEPAIGEFMRDLLETWGLAVVLASGAIEARDAFAREPDRFDAVPVLLYSGYADARAEDEARAAGVAATLRKPIDPAALLAAIEPYLARTTPR